jgi:hypothetical protein
LVLSNSNARNIFMAASFGERAVFNFNSISEPSSEI